MGGSKSEKVVLPPELAALVAHLSRVTTDVSKVGSLAQSSKAQALAAEKQSFEANKVATSASQAAAEAIASAAAAIAVQASSGRAAASSEDSPRGPPSHEPAMPEVAGADVPEDTPRAQEPSFVSLDTHAAMEERVNYLEAEMYTLRQEIQKASVELQDQRQPLSPISPSPWGARRRVGSMCSGGGGSVSVGGLESRPHSPSTVAVPSPSGGSQHIQLVSQARVSDQSLPRVSDQSLLQDSPESTGAATVPPASTPPGSAAEGEEVLIAASRVVSAELLGLDAVPAAQVQKELGSGRSSHPPWLADAPGGSDATLSQRSEAALRDIRSTRAMIEATERALKRVQAESISASRVVSRLEAQADQWRLEAKQARDFRKSVTDSVDQMLGKAKESEAQLQALLSRGEKREDAKQRAEEAARAKVEAQLRQRLQRCEHDIQELGDQMSSRLASYEDHLSAHARHLEAVVTEQSVSRRQMFAAQEATMQELQQLEIVVQDLKDRAEASSPPARPQEVSQAHGSTRSHARGNSNSSPTSTPCSRSPGAIGFPPEGSRQSSIGSRGPGGTMRAQATSPPPRHGRRPAMGQTH